MKISDEGSLNPLDDDDELHVVTMSGHNFSSSQAFYMQYSGTPTQVGRCLKQFQSSRVDWAFFKDKVNGGRLVRYAFKNMTDPEARSGMEKIIPDPLQLTIARGLYFGPKRYLFPPLPPTL
jgi:hypothetical protein